MTIQCWRCSDVASKSTCCHLCRKSPIDALCYDNNDFFGDDLR